MESRDRSDFLKIKQKVLQSEKPYCYFRQVKSLQSFKLRKSPQEPVFEIFSLEDLLKGIERAPQEAIIFHLQNGNDFAQWVSEIIGYQELSKKLRQVELTHPEEARQKLVGILYTALTPQFYSDHLR